MVGFTSASRRDATPSPIAKASSEIMSAFFREAFKYNSTRTSVTLSHVSRTWRQIAINDPFLWNSIDVSPQGPSAFSKLCLERSQQADLDVRYSDDVEYELNEEEVAPFDPAMLHLYRCRELELVFADRSCAFAVLNSLKRKAAPRLVFFEVVLDGNGRFWTHQDRPGDIFTGGAPLLTSLTLHGVSPLECHVPLSNIIKLSLTDFGRHSHQYPDLYPSEFVAVLREVASTLKHLELDGSQVFSTDESPWSAVELPVLVTLNIRDEDEEHREECEDYQSNFWEFVRMPALEDLSLSFLGSSQVAEVWLALKGKCGARVKSLSLVNVGLEEVEDTLAERFPNLHSLSLGDGMILNVLTSLVDGDEQCASSGETVECPELQHLTLEDCYEDEDADIVQSFLLGRMAAGHPIRKIVFRGRKLAYAPVRFALENAAEVIIENHGSSRPYGLESEESESEGG
ncbi:hypothetical protein FIBSPDRAFT_1054432 [Athelia psychrophila]|uniref:F-box domain-containing protein n=1 Tax=Athelia psychrophila TaxID=1759441 RepID=A0A167UIU0_9AGAM|nr:hypothetical protein FIBSPDRAFT_941230 [Fibularhizoctonia sp. CBS 109695]KZP04821.1 hypothetical protein FIBSPDRAFT_1054432 [Fibularhizoctonia sp. CBS 109695]